MKYLITGAIRQWTTQDDPYNCPPSTKNESNRKATIIQRMIQSEASRALYSKIRSIVKPSEFATLSQLQIPRDRSCPYPTQPGEVHDILKIPPENLIWDTIITRSEIEEHLVQFNWEAFRAAAEPPCGHGVILHATPTFSSLSPAAEALLCGIVHPE